MKGQLAEFLPRQRWFAGAGDDVEVTDVSWLRLRPDLWHAIVTVRYAGGPPATYHLPLGLREPGEPLPWLPDDALLGEVGLDDGRRVVAYDAVHDPDLTLAWPERCGVAVASTGHVLGAEQSNTSLGYGDEVFLKLYRRLTTGPHPEVEIGTALTAIGSRVIVPVLGTWTEEPYVLGLAQPFHRSGTEGWALALASVRSRFASPEGDAADEGGDFTAEARRLGAVTAEMHADLATALPSRVAGPEETAATTAQLHDRLSRAAGAVPDLRPLRERVSAVYDELARWRDPVPVQRIHGDYHLGQTMRIDAGWVVLDFEGEPARPVGERRALMSPLRDVAGMLRSFDYAARHLLADVADAGALEPTAAEWSARNRAAFCAGYAEVAGTDPREHDALLRAFELDKAVYEVVYEAGHRPSWLPIPLGGIERLTGQRVP